MLPAEHRHSISEVDLQRQTGSCSRCGPVSVYYRANKGIWACRVARSQGSQEYEATKRVRSAESIALYRLDKRLQRFGLTHAEFEALRDTQGWACAICREAPSGILSIDHDHSTGAVRGLLCRPCNLALGLFRDDPQRMAAAIEYLRHQP